MSGNILITGGAQRFGRELAFALHDAGYSVTITYRHQRDSLTEMADAGISCIQADFSDADRTSAFINKVCTEFSALRAVIHNASEWLPESQKNAPAEVLKANWVVHVQAPYMINLAFEELLAAGAQHYGMADIIHLTDYVAERGSSKHIAYAASKAALHNMTLSFATKLAPAVKVNSIAPALLMFRESDDEVYRKRVENKSLLPPGPGAREGIEAVQLLLNSKYITGRNLPLDGGRQLKTG